MAQTTHETAWNEQLWNVSLLPTLRGPRTAQVASGPARHDRGDALRSAALLSLVESEIPGPLALAA